MIAVGERLWEVVAGLIVAPVLVGPFLSTWAGNRAKRRGASPAVVRGLHSLIALAWVGVAAYGVSLAFGPIPFLSTLTATAVLGIAVTLALQTTLQNIVAGFLLQRRGFLRPSDDVQFAGVSGRIASIGLVTTVLKLPDGTLAFVSNSNLLSGPVTNRSASARLAGEY